jgi:hypothetical protein
MAAAKPRSKGAPAAAAKAKTAPAEPTAAEAAAAVATGAKGKDAAKDLAVRLKDPAFQRDIEQAVRELPPEKAAELVAMLEASMRRRKLELYGYLAAAAIVLFGMVGALVVMGSGKGGSLIGWIFLAPLALAGLVMWRVGKRARAHEKRGRPAARRPAS